MAYQFQNDATTGRSAAWWPEPEAPQMVSNQPGGFPLRMGPLLTLRIEPRGFILFGLSILFYVMSAFVGNEWCYLIPAGILSVVLIGIFLPVIEVLTIDTSFSVVCSPLNPQAPEIRVSIRRKPIFQLFSFMVPSGYLNARLLLQRRGWQGSQSAPLVVPLPGMIESLNHGFDARLKVPALRRGVYELQNVEISSCFPFAVAWCSRLAKPAIDEARREITVYPQVVPVFGNFHSRLSDTDSSSGRQIHSWSRPSQSMSLRGLREFTERDSLTHIHWSSSARSGKLMVREFEIESIAEFDVALDLTAIWSEAQFELAATAAYSLLRYGHLRGFIPQLILLPTAEHELLAELLAHCPGGLAGEEHAAELLARVSPLPESLRKLVYADAQSKPDNSNARRSLVGILPGRESGAIAIVEFGRAISLANKESGREAAISDLMRVIKELAQVETELELSRL